MMADTGPYAEERRKHCLDRSLELHARRGSSDDEVIETTLKFEELIKNGKKDSPSE